MSLTNVTSKQKRWLFFTARLCFTFTLLWGLSWIADVKQVWRLAQRGEAWLLASTVALAVLRVPLGALRWAAMDPSEDVSLAEYQRYLMVNGFVNLFLPMLAGDATRAMHTVAEGRSGSTAFAVFADRVLGFFSILMMGSVAIMVSEPFEGRLRLLGLLIAAILAVVVLTILARRLSESRWLRDKLPAPVQKIFTLLSESVRFYARNPWRVLAALTLCLPLHGLWFLMVWVLALALQVQIGFWELSAYTAIVLVVTAIPMSLNGLGIREFGYTYLFASRGLSPELAVALSMYQFATLFFVGLMGAPFFISVRATSRRRAASSESPPPNE